MDTIQYYEEWKYRVASSTTHYMEETYAAYSDVCIQ
jgi:hypothetical protein